MASADRASAADLAYSLSILELVPMLAFTWHQARRCLHDTVLLAVIDARVDAVPDILSDVRAIVAAPVILLKEYDEAGLDGEVVVLRMETPATTVALHAARLISSRPQVVAALRRWGPLQVDSSSHQAWVGGFPLDLTLHQFRLLDALMDAEGAVVRDEDLACRLYGRILPGDRDRVAVHVKRLRRRLAAAQPDLRSMVQRVRGMGYRLTPLAG